MDILPILAAGLVMATGGNLPVNDDQALVCAKNECKVITPVCELQLKRGAVVLVRHTGDTVLIRNLHEQRKNSVSIFSGKSHVPVALGQELFVSPDKTHAAAQTNDGIRRRRAQFSQLEKLTIRACDYNLQDNLINEKLVNTLQSGGPQERKLLNDLMKTTAIWTIVTRGRGPDSRNALTATNRTTNNAAAPPLQANNQH